jgi:hypothetical protein
MKLYIAGPMTGLTDLNYPTFFAAAEQLVDAGHEPINPARAEGREGCKTWADYMRVGIRDVLDCEGVALLEGWENSQGATLERFIAIRLDVPVRTLGEWLGLDEIFGQ